jgi:hypothetical protein
MTRPAELIVIQPVLFILHVIRWSSSASDIVQHASPIVPMDLQRVSLADVCLLHVSGLCHP